MCTPSVSDDLVVLVWEQSKFCIEVFSRKTAEHEKSNDYLKVCLSSICKQNLMWSSMKMTLVLMLRALCHAISCRLHLETFCTLGCKICVWLAFCIYIKYQNFKSIFSIYCWWAICIKNDFVVICMNWRISSTQANKIIFIV